MNALSTAVTIRPDVLWKWGRGLLWVALALATAAVFGIAWEYGWLVALVPAGMVGAVGLAALLRRFPASLYIVLLAFVTITAHETGLQAHEVAYGLLYLGFLAYWFVTRFAFYRDDVLRTATDWSLFLFLVVAAFSTVATLLFEGRMTNFMGEGLALSMIVFYYPVKEAVRDHRRALVHLALVVSFFGIFAAVRNLFIFRRALSEAVYLWQVTTGRIALNEILLMVPALGALTLLIYARPIGRRLILLFAFLLFFTGLIITQSRAYWISFLLGVLLLFFAVDWRRRARILLLMLIGVSGFLALGALLFPGFLKLFFIGVVDRFASLATATQTDISLLNRFNETRAVWEHIKANPILGYGMGTPYQYYAFIYKATRDWSFIHNGYVALWFKYGLAGAGLLLFFWASSLRHAFLLFRRTDVGRAIRLAALVTFVCLGAETLVANTSNPFIIEDGNLMFAILAGVVAGCRERIDRTPPADEQDPSLE